MKTWFSLIFVFQVCTRRHAVHLSLWTWIDSHWSAYFDLWKRWHMGSQSTKMWTLLFSCKGFVYWYLPGIVFRVFYYSYLFLLGTKWKFELQKWLPLPIIFGIYAFSWDEMCFEMWWRLDCYVIIHRHLLNLQNRLNITEKFVSQGSIRNTFFKKSSHMCKKVAILYKVRNYDCSNKRLSITWSMTKYYKGKYDYNNDCKKHQFPSLCEFSFACRIVFSVHQHLLCSIRGGNPCYSFPRMLICYSFPRMLILTERIMRQTKENS